MEKVEFFLSAATALSATNPSLLGAVGPFYCPFPSLSFTSGILCFSSAHLSTTKAYFLHCHCRIRANLSHLRFFSSRPVSYFFCRSSRTSEAFHYPPAVHFLRLLVLRCHPSSIFLSPVTCLLFYSFFQ